MACVTGRFQPAHLQHVELWELALQEADHLIVAITNPDAAARRENAASSHRHLASSNPFTYYQRARMIQAVCAERGIAGRVTIVPFDLTRPESWSDYVPFDAVQWVRVYSEWERHKAQVFADAGYPVRTLEGDTGTRISSTDIRARIEAGVEYAQLVPEAVGEYLA